MEQGKASEEEADREGIVYSAEEVSGEYLKSRLSRAMEEVFEDWENSVLGNFYPVCGLLCH